MADNEETPVREKGESNEDYIERLKGELFQKPKEKNAAFNARIRGIVNAQKAKEAEIEAKKKDAFDKMIAEAKRLFQIAPPGAEGNVVRNAAIAALKTTGFNATNYEGHAATIKQRREFAAAEEAQRKRIAEERARVEKEERAKEEELFNQLVKLYTTHSGSFGREQAERYVNILLDVKLRTGYYDRITLSEVYRIMIGEKILEEEEVEKRRAAKRAAASGASAAQGGPRGASPPRGAWPGQGTEAPEWKPPSSKLNPYTILGVEKSVTQAEIKKAYHAKALKHHPDKRGDPEEFKKVQAAFEVLSDPDKRAEYNITGEFKVGGKRKTRRAQKSKRKTRRRS